MKKWNKTGLYSYLLKGIICLVLLTLLMAFATAYLSDHVSRVVISYKYGKDIWNYAEWPQSAYELLNQIYNFFDILFIIIILLGIVLITGQMRRRILKPLIRLEKAIEELSERTETDIFQPSGLMEVDTILEKFNDMACRLKKSEEERARAEADKQKMLADISHDLKTPITVIQGYAEAVYQGVPGEETKQKYLQTICHKAEQMSELINSFCEYSRLEHPQFIISEKKGDICEYFREYLAMKYEELEIDGFVLCVDLPEEEINCDFDPYQLKRAFENIILNSQRHNIVGTTIYATMEKKEETVIIRIGDNGKGIADSIRDSVFKPFVVGNEARTSGMGTGLGMAISKKIIELHGGNIILLPENDQIKTMFEIQLPCARS